MKKEGFSMWTFSKRGFLALIALIWIAILGVISPAWFSIGVVLVTGTSKGIGVSLGSEGNLYFCARSEERRVGKECRSRWSPYH